MTVEQLQDRISKSKIKIEKIEKRITKWQNAKCEKEFIKKYSWLLSMGRDRNYLYNEYLKECDYELKSATQDLEDAQLTLNKYQNMLNLELNKDNEFENNRIKIIWDFLLNYKEQVAEFIRDNMSVLNEYYEVNSKLCNWHNTSYSRIYNGEITREEYNRVEKELREKEKELLQEIHPYTKLVAIRNYSDRTSVVDENKLEEILLKDCKEKYFQLVNQVTDIVGIITDASNLKIKAGELNGIITGTTGKAKVQTFSAGGHSQYIIVNDRHGQCFHYRTKVSKID